MDVFVATIAAVAAALSVPYWVVAARRYARGRGSRQAPRATIAEAIAETSAEATGKSRKPGRYRIRGTVQPSEHLLEAPLTGRACAYYRIDVQHGFVGVHDLGRASDACDFTISDGTGEALVRIEGVMRGALRDELAKDFIDPGDNELALAERLVELGVARPIAGGGFRQMMTFEAALLVGDEIELVGTVKPDRAPDAAAVTEHQGYRDAPLRLLVVECQLLRVRENGVPQKIFEQAPKP